MKKSLEARRSPLATQLSQSIGRTQVSRAKQQAWAARLKNSVAGLVATARRTLLALCSLGAAASLSSALAQQPSLSNQRPVVNAKPVLLPWRQIKWPAVDFSRTSLKAGGSLYVLKESSEKKFRLELVFAGGTFSLNPEQRPAMGALIDLLLLGGAGKRSYQDIQNYALTEGLQFNTQVSGTGGLQVSVSGLAKDFKRALPILEDILIAPRFEPSALDLWKQMQADEFASSLDASNGRKQQAFVQQEIARLIYGPDHFYSKTLERKSTKVTSKVTLAEVKALHPRLVNATGVKCLLAGGVGSVEEKALIQSLAKIPDRPYEPLRWLPTRPVDSGTLGAGGASAKGHKTRVTIIRKADLSQSQVSYQIFAPSMGQLNEMERTQFSILSEVFSSTGGVVGNDRFSKALRGDSGLSYSPHAHFDDNAMEPNTNVAAWRMGFQSPNESVGKAVEIASQTWSQFEETGIKEDELERARISLMNRMLATELTLFDRSSLIWDDVLQSRIPNPLFLEATLARLEQEKSVGTLNTGLGRFGGHGNQRALVIFGNPPAEEIQKIKSLPGFEIAKEVPFSKLTEDLKK